MRSGWSVWVRGQSGRKSTDKGEGERDGEKERG